MYSLNEFHCVCTFDRKEKINKGSWRKVSIYNIQYVIENIFHKLIFLNRLGSQYPWLIVIDNYYGAVLRMRLRNASLDESWPEWHDKDPSLFNGHKRQAEADRIPNY